MTSYSQDTNNNNTIKVSQDIAQNSLLYGINMPLNNEQTINSMGTVWNINAPELNNYTEKDFVYNSYSDYRAPSYNEWTRSYNDNCSEENRLRVGTKPMKYFVNQYNSPQVAPFMEFTLIGNQKSYDVRNDFERPMPTRLNPIYPTTVEPYLTTGFLGQPSESREYTDTSSVLRFGANSHELRSATAITEKDYNRFNPAVTQDIVQNAGQFNVGNISRQDDNGYYNYYASNNISLGNDAAPRYGASSRNLMQNMMELSNC